MAEEARARRGEVDHVQQPIEANAPCPDPTSPDAIKALFGAFYRRMWAAAHTPLTMQDIVASFNASRLAAGIGKREEAAKEHRLDMGSLLGGKSEDEPAK